MITEDVTKAVEALESGDLVAIPTETVYGLAGNAFSEVAIRKIFALKKRPLYNPLIVHLKSFDALDEVAQHIPEMALELGRRFWPGPLTLLLEKRNCISDLVTAGKNTVAVRVPDHAVTLNLLQKISFPLVAPSANPFGSISPTSAQHVFNYFGDELDVILEGSDCKRGIESTIIGFENNRPILYRHGSISIEEIEAVVGKVSVSATNPKINGPDQETDVKAPGMLSRHYAPSTQMFLTNDVQQLMNAHHGKKIGVLSLKKITAKNEAYAVEVLSENGDLVTAAKHLYGALHRLDTQNLDVIIAETFPNEGLGKTINDRLKRGIQK